MQPSRIDEARWRMPVKHKSKRGRKVSAPVAIPIATFGEVFDGAMIELIRDITTDTLRLLLWDGAKETIGLIVKYKGRFYEPAAISRSLLRGMTLPTHSSPHGTARALLADISKLAADFILLPEKFASLIGRFVLSSWRLEAAQIAPALAIAGPDISRGIQLLDLLHCLGRHPVRMSGVTPAALCSLPSALGCTLLISQSTISGKMQRFLDDTSRRGQKVPFRGGLLDLYAARRSVFGIRFSEWAVVSPVHSNSDVTTAQRIPILDAGIQNHIASEFKPKLLDFVGRIWARLAVSDLTWRASVTNCGRWLKASRPQRRTRLTCRRRWANCSGTRKRMCDRRNGWI